MTPEDGKIAYAHGLVGLICESDHPAKKQSTNSMQFPSKFQCKASQEQKKVLK